MDEAITPLHRLLSIEMGEIPSPRMGVLVSNAKHTKRFFDAYNHFAYLYIQYVLSYNKFEKCYDLMTQPQIRIESKKFLQLCASHLIDLRCRLVQCYPTNPHFKVDKGQQQPPFLWEYIDLNDEIRQSELTHEESCARIPRYFKEEIGPQMSRDVIICGYMNMSFNKKIFIDDILPESNHGACSHNQVDSVNVDQSRSDDNVSQEVDDYAVIRKIRKQQQTENKSQYGQVLSDIRCSMQNDEFLIRQELIDARTSWVTQLVAEGKSIPENLDGFYSNNDGVDYTPDGSSQVKVDKAKHDKTTTEMVYPNFDSLSSVTEKLFESVQHFIEKLSPTAESFATPFDIYAAQKRVREEVENKLRIEVDKNMTIKLKKHSLVNSEAKPKVKKAKPKKSKTKNKRGGKSLPGTKLGDIKRMDIDQMLSLLVEYGIIRYPKKVNIQDLKGHFRTTGGFQHEHESVRVRKLF